VLEITCQSKMNVSTDDQHVLASTRYVVRAATGTKLRSKLRTIAVSIYIGLRWLLIPSHRNAEYRNVISMSSQCSICEKTATRFCGRIRCVHTYGPT
jgi:hypothetical protein